MAKPPVEKSSVSSFLTKAKKHDLTTASAKRLILALDATASREPTWDVATSLHADLFTAASSTALNVQLAYFRGLNEFHASAWQATPHELLQQMQVVRCRGGQTQILRVLRHAKREAAAGPVKALVFIGDCCEEPEDNLLVAAGELGIVGVPVFVFQEGNDRHANRVFSAIAQRSRGAHVPFSAASGDALKKLLTAVATYVAEGQSAAVKRLSDPVSQRLLKQLDP